MRFEDEIVTLQGFKTAHKKGKAEGRAEERLANARRMKADNLPIELISKYTGLTSEEIAAI